MDQDQRREIFDFDLLDALEGREKPSLPQKPFLIGRQPQFVVNAASGSALHLPHHIRSKNLFQVSGLKFHVMKANELAPLQRSHFECSGTVS
ncbi:MAG: hypothetical protein Q8M07_14545 [Prosthecobacter sp.]|nr:hypothetical protein [Prosthecobacter sp.]